jgi:hypothetical protein
MDWSYTSVKREMRQGIFRVASSGRRPMQAVQDWDAPDLYPPGPDSYPPDIPARSERNQFRDPYLLRQEGVLDAATNLLMSSDKSARLILGLLIYFVMSA